MSRRPTLRTAWTWLRGEPWRLAAAAIGFAATLVGLVLGVLELTDRLFPPPTPSDPSVAIVLDRSASMAEPWAGGIAFDDARETLDAVLADEHDHNVELRAFGGDCDSESARLVAWGTDNAGRIGDELADIGPEGQANLATAIADTVRDFDDRTRFPDKIGKRIVIITRGHSCPSDAQRSIRELFQRLGAERKLALDFEFVGLGVPPEQRGELEEIARAVNAGSPHFPEDENELEAVLDAVVVEEPVLRSIEAIHELANASVSDLNTCADSIYDDPDPDLADESLTRARAAVEESNTSLQQLGGSYTRPALGQLYSLAVTKLGIQRELLALAERDRELASRREGERGDAVREAVGEWNDLVDAHNKADAGMRGIVRRLGL
jgi:hypothetical protein